MEDMTSFPRRLGEKYDVYDEADDDSPSNYEQHSEQSLYARGLFKKVINGNGINLLGVNLKSCSSPDLRVSTKFGVTIPYSWTQISLPVKNCLTMFFKRNPYFEPTTKSNPEELKITNTEKTLLKRLVKELQVQITITQEKTTIYEKTIISLLKGGVQKFEESLQSSKTHIATATEYLHAPTMFVQTPSTVRKSNSKMNKRGEQPTERARPSRGKHEVMKGNSSLSFAGTVKRAWLHIGRAKIGMQPQHIGDYQKSRFPDSMFTVEMLPNRDDACIVQGNQ
ncbi:hypothetical protein WA026_020827 [Henosepilachna vigintioctopunctata]|uniref:Uncharacterized protein n=1 Tax=Henosepilachna vigintioctopunctata TaxID=420089 RepID=A0AAW1TRY8_9CUCU